MENWFLGEKLIALGKYFSWGKFAEGKTPNSCVTFSVKKKNLYLDPEMEKNLTETSTVQWMQHAVYYSIVK